MLCQGVEMLQARLGGLVWCARSVSQVVGCQNQSACVAFWFGVAVAVMAQQHVFESSPFSWLPAFQVQLAGWLLLAGSLLAAACWTLGGRAATSTAGDPAAHCRCAGAGLVWPVLGQSAWVSSIST